MDTSAVDFPALAVLVLAAIAISAAIGVAGRDGNRWRRWLGAIAVTVLLIAVGLADLLRESPRETHLATLFVGIPLPVLAALATERLTRRVRPWLRWLVVWMVTFASLATALLIGAAIAPRFLP